MKLRLVGTEVPPSVRRTLDVADLLRRMERLTESASDAIPVVAPPSPAATPVFEDQNGDRYALVPTPCGPQWHRWISGAALNEQRTSEGGLLPAARLTAMQADAEAARSRLAPVQAAALEAMARLGMLDTVGDSAPATAAAGVGARAGERVNAAAASRGEETRKANKSTADDRGAPPPEGPEEAPADTGEPIPGFNRKPPEAEPNVKEPFAAIGATIGTLGQAFQYGSLGFSALSGGLSGLISGLAMAAGHSFVEKIQPDDTDSTAEWGVKTVGPLLGKQILSMGNMNKFFGMGPPKNRALRKDDMDELGNAIATGAADVLIENKPAAREGDGVNSIGVGLQYGAKFVSIGGMPAARTDDTWSAVAPFIGPPPEACRPHGCANRTEIGRGTTNTHPEKPPELEGWAKQRWGTSDLPEIEPMDNGAPSCPPAEHGWSFDKSLGEWRIWDGEGYSLTLSEYENLGDWGSFWLPTGGVGIRDLFISHDTKELSWHIDTNILVLNTFDLPFELFDINLGSPQFPGAGNSMSWWVPDRINILPGVSDAIDAALGPGAFDFMGGWPLDFNMVDYYRDHDWRFDPNDPTRAFHLFEPLVEDEFPAFRSGINLRNPVQWPVQIIYSLGTTIPNYLGWTDTNLRALDEWVGIPVEPK